MTDSSSLRFATLGGGCFWCTEAVYRKLRGVDTVEPGYSGGTLENPTYEAVCSGATGHAEVIRIAWDPDEISFQTILDVFFSTHDPTTLNRQGNDVGSQYRSVVFYHDDEQREAAERTIDKLNSDSVFSDPVVTEVRPFEKFYPAEDYHHDYFARNPRQPYCNAIIPPKLRKLQVAFGRQLKVDGGA